jgi:hypothetical protein
MTGSCSISATTPTSAALRRHRLPQKSHIRDPSARHSWRSAGKHTFVHSTNTKGNVAEAAITLAAIKLGVDVLKPVGEHGRYDLAFDVGTRVLRVQCKWGAADRDVIYVHTSRCRTKRRGYVRTTYMRDEIDALAVYCGELDCCYLLPVEMVAGRYAVHLRLRPPKNAQRAAVNWAADYEFGAVAQLGRAREWHSRGRGFESHQLHSSDADKASVVGANSFRDRFGYYMQRAASGDRGF